MAKDLVPVGPRASSSLHPTIYAAIAALILLLVFWIWVGFADTGYTEFLLAVVSGFFLMFAAIPLAIWHMWRKHSGEANDHESLRDWSAHEFNIEPGPMQGREAAVEVLLPIAAVAFGMMAIAIVLLLTSHNVI
jgi:energy-coupling factor transporter transmembrane protein EcfT